MKSLEFKDLTEFKLMIGIVDILADGKKLMAHALNILYDLDKQGSIFVRVPYTNKWDTVMINAVYLLSSMFVSCRFWKTPWSSRCYLVCYKKKKSLSRQQYSKILNFLRSPGKNLFKAGVFISNMWMTTLNSLLSAKINKCELTSEEWFKLYADDLCNIKRKCDV